MLSVQDSEIWQRIERDPKHPRNDKTSTYYEHTFGFEAHGRVWSMYYNLFRGFMFWESTSKDQALVDLVAHYKDPAIVRSTWLYLEAPYPSYEELKAAEKTNTYRRKTDLPIRVILEKHCRPVLLSVPDPELVP